MEEIITGKESFFSRLYKKKDVEEDYVTEAMAAVLRGLSPENLTELFRKLGLDEIEFIVPAIDTQQITASGRNDLVITDKNVIIFFENKWNSPTDIGQLYRYDEELCKKEKEWRILIHITKDFKEINEDFKNRFKKINWSDLYAALKSLDFKDKYLIEQFLLFLKERGITMEKVTWEILNGSKAIYNLTQLIKSACQKLGVSCDWATSTSSLYTGQWIANKLGAYFLIDQACLLFTSSKPQPNILEMNIRWGSQYAIKFDFDKHYFFHKNLEGQEETIKEFINDLLYKMES